MPRRSTAWRHAEVAARAAATEGGGSHSDDKPDILAPMNTHPFESVIVDTGENPKTCVIWLHGLGADGHDFEPIVPEMQLPPGKPVRFIFPHAPVRRVTINNGMPMRAWYDFRELAPGEGEDHGQVGEGVAAVQTLLAEARRHYDTVLLGGFSQGGAMALLTGLVEGPAPDAVFGLSTYLPDAAKAGLQLSPRAAGLPIFMGHGSFDPVIPPDFGRHTSQALRAMGVTLQWHEYPMPHSVCPDEIRDLSRWMGPLIQA
ncbi:MULTISPECIES: alpha/beta hydrolase [Ectothiorhodospira]|nr:MULTISPECIES: carboxylesterase [Ectothiorhodospira]MCG5494207.1 carboxylesterase [Ectothiorhodospira variabilis]MCG5496373.1 carboxylesterase [Ectothiorhodospira variabilis]MCG5504847.1 carboxylesterase [Ectothiorhodospira variabilis]MCG5508004.1 carboxylesterase [Ectothiorhodospira variabilis]MCG5525845.1 carboxylesterase [Ectothiorhodospira haloalkaliphila]